MSRNIKLWTAMAVCACMTACGPKTVDTPPTQPQESRTAPQTAQAPVQGTTADVVKPSNAAPETIESFPLPAPEPLPGGGLEEKPEGAVRIILMTDLHYLSQELTDNGNAFQDMLFHGDGKLVNYVDEITDAALEEVIEEEPDALILSGDLSLEGEKKSHERLAQKLRVVRDAGIPVLVIPGNHDINNPLASSYKEDIRFPAEPTAPSDFLNIYREFGYDEAFSTDEASLSYVYELEGNIRLLMLDSCQYTPRNRVGGMIRGSTYEWIEEQMQGAWNDGVYVIPVSHHNLLDESQVYVDDCTIEHSERLIELLESWGVNIYLSGHLHVQHFMEHNGIGIYEIVTSSLATPPCQYGVLDYYEDGGFSYRTKAVDMEKWARLHGNEDKNLLHFEEYGQTTLSQIFYNQAYGVLSRAEGSDKPLPEQMDQMARIYSRLFCYWYAGRAAEIVDKIKDDPALKLWDEFGYPGEICEYLNYIVEGASEDYNWLEED